jgi:probable rRNA maturation factor
VNRVQFNWERRPSRPAADPLRATINSCLERLECGPCEVHVLVSGDSRIRDLNRTYLGRDTPTDVLSFPDGDMLPDGRRLLGQIVVSLDAARRQAETQSHSEIRELQELVLHATLHLLGYDHANDQGEMNSLELGLREELLS